MNLLQIDPMLGIPALGETNLIPVNKFGRNGDIDTNTDPEDIWEGGGIYSFPTSAQIIQVASASTDDDGDPVGTGARTVTIYGLDSNWQMANETVTMNGTTTVETTGTFIRVFRAIVMTAGSGGVNAGLITITYKAAATTAAVIAAGSGQTLMAVYTIPSGYSGFMTRMYATLNSSLNNAAGSRGSVRLLHRANADTSDPSWQVKHEESVVIDGTSSMLKVFQPYLRITQKTDVKLQVKSVSDNDTDVDGGFDIILVKNTLIDEQKANYMLERII